MYSILIAYTIHDPAINIIADYPKNLLMHLGNPATFIDQFCAIIRLIPSTDSIVSAQQTGSRSQKFKYQPVYKSVDGWQR